MEKPLVSITVPLYNKAPYIEECLSSLKDQTLHDIEVIVVDDGSTDGSGNIARAFCESNEHFTYIRQENEGVSGALNRGLAHASGEFIGRVDADDWVEPEMFETLYQAAKGSGVLHARCGSIRECRNGSRREYPICASPEIRSGFWCLHTLFSQAYPPFMNTYLGLYSRQLLLDFKLAYAEELSNLEDIYFNARYFPLVTSIVLVPELLYHYREDPASLSQRADIGLPAQLGIFEKLMQHEVLDTHPQLADAYSQYRSIALLTTAADMSAHGTAGMRALAASAMYHALCENAQNITVPSSLRILISLLNAKSYTRAVWYSKILKSARALRRKILSR